MARAEDLRIGDRIRFLRMPSIFSLPGFLVHEETLAFYSLLISTGDFLVVSEFIDGRPFAEYVDHRTEPGTPLFHSLVIDDDDDGAWVRVI